MKSQNIDEHFDYTFTIILKRNLLENVKIYKNLLSYYNKNQRISSTKITKIGLSALDSK